MVTVAVPLLLRLFGSKDVVVTDAVAVIDPASTARAVTTNTADEPLSSVPAVQTIAAVPEHPGEAERKVSADGRLKCTVTSVAAEVPASLAVNV